MSARTVRVTLVFERRFTRKVDAAAHRRRLVASVARQARGWAVADSSAQSRDGEWSDQDEVRRRNRQSAARRRAARFDARLGAVDREWCRATLNTEGMRSYGIRLVTPQRFCWPPERSLLIEVVPDISGLHDRGLGRQGVAWVCVPALRQRVLHQIAHVLLARRNADCPLPPEAGTPNEFHGRRFIATLASLVKKHYPGAAGDAALALLALGGDA